MKKTTSLLIEEPPLQVLPTLAAKIGLNEAIVLQQIQYWIKTTGHKRDGRAWIYNSAKAWQEQFPFWSIRTIERIVASLREKKLILTANYNAAKFDKTLWYSIDYDAVSAASMPTTCRDDDDNMAASYSDNLSAPIPETTETTTEKKDLPREKKRAAAFPAAMYETVEKAFSEAYQERTKKEYKGGNPSAGRSALQALFRAGVTPEDAAAVARRYVPTCDAKYRRFTVAAFCAHYPDMIADGAGAGTRPDKKEAAHAAAARDWIE